MSKFGLVLGLGIVLAISAVASGAWADKLQNITCEQFLAMDEANPFSKAMLLGVPFAANLGGFHEHRFTVLWGEAFADSYRRAIRSSGSRSMRGSEPAKAACARSVAKGSRPSAILSRLPMMVDWPERSEPSQQPPHAVMSSFPTRRRRRIASSRS
mgnify:CR=1 FL=1